MASVYITNALQIDLDSVLGIQDNDAMVQDGDVTCAVSGKYVAISEDRFACVFNLPTDGLADLSEVRNHLVLQERSVFSKSEKPVQYSCKKRLLKYEFRLLNEILAKSITVKARSFDAVTHERFFMITAIHFGVKINWIKILLVLKEMADRTVKRAKGFAAQICTVNTYVATNKTIDSWGESEEPHVDKVAILKRNSKKKSAPTDKKATDEEPVEVVEKSVSKKRSAITGDEPAVTKKKRTTKKKAALSKANMDLVGDVCGKLMFGNMMILPRLLEQNVVLGKADIEEPVEQRSEDMIVEISEESISIEDLLQQIPGDALLPSVLAVEPTRITFSNEISIPGLADGDLYKESLPKITLADKGKAPLIEAGVVKGHPAREMVQLIFGDIEFLIQLREQVIDEVSAFFNSFTLRRLPVLKSLRDITVKEEKVLTWAETDSVQIALQRRLYIVAKYRELMLWKFLESHRAYFSFGEPWSAMALQIIDLLSIAHYAAVNELLMQRKAHVLQWTRSCCSILFEGVYDRVFYIPRNHETIVSTCWIRLLRFVGGSWMVESGYDRWVYECETPVSQLWEKLPEQIELTSLAPICLFFEAFQRLSTFSLPAVKSWGTEYPEEQVLPRDEPSSSDDSVVYRSPSLDAEPSVQTSLVVDITSVPTDFASLSSGNSDLSLPSPHQSPSTDSSLHFNSEDILQGAATAVEQILVPSTAAPDTDINEQFAQLRSSISELSIKQLRTQRKIGDLQNAILSKIDTREKATAEAHLRKEVKDLKAHLSKEFDDKLAVIRNDLLEFRVETQEQLASLSTNLAELIAFVTKGRDDKKGEVGSSHGRGQPPPGDGGGSGSRSESSKRRYDRSGGPRKRSAEYWFGGNKVKPVFGFSDFVQILCTVFPI
ncbi:dirigent protein 21-like [Dorcoceras hygrometricum]|uniref:Dirigent protein 21-like n=1 Tax=Dorcoceras hygrometricum TaxID=472368 RepID=A0A2Z7BVQ4_9LAMI|nr:dirigent protein 21-like [Dorcoceras hygrometricum]